MEAWRVAVLQGDSRHDFREDEVALHGCRQAQMGVGIAWCGKRRRPGVEPHTTAVCRIGTSLLRE